MLQLIGIALLLGFFAWLFHYCFCSIPPFMRRLATRRSETLIAQGKTSWLHRHSFTPVPWDNKRLGVQFKMDAVPDHINPLNPPRMTDRFLYRCTKSGCGAEKMFTVNSMI